MAKVNAHAAVQPKQYVLQKEESSISQGIGNAMGPFVAKMTALGFASGLVVGIVQSASIDSNIPLVAGPIIGATMAGGGAALITKGFQSAADAGANAAIYTVKVPFRIAYATASLLCRSTAYAYQSVMGSAK